MNSERITASIAAGTAAALSNPNALLLAPVGSAFEFYDFVFFVVFVPTIPIALVPRLTSKPILQARSPVHINNAVKPLLVFAAAPYGAIGVLIALAITHTGFGFMAFLNVKDRSSGVNIQDISEDDVDLNLLEKSLW